MSKKEWFDDWFDSPYYHILYKHRDYEEAQLFINNLIRYLHITPDQKILDLACGKGRHSIYLNEKGFDVEGLDLSKRNIAFASQFENQRLKFHVHDMRDVFRPDSFDYIFNLFTSFGYLDSKEENLAVLESVMASLKSGGRLLIDFLNPYVVINNLVNCEEKEIGGVSFKINREYTEDQYILKKIDIRDNGSTYHFMEKVKAIRRVEFLEYFEKSNFKVLDVFGDYHLNAHVADQSDRLIMLVEK